MEDYIKELLTLFISNSSESVGTMFVGVAIVVAAGLILPRIRIPERFVQASVAFGFVVIFIGFVKTLFRLYDFSWVTWEHVVLSSLFLVSAYILWKRFRLLSYKLSIIPTLTNADSDGNREPIITVLNMGKEKVSCFCKIEFLSIDGLEKNIYDINPYSHFLSWGNKNLTTLYPNVPQTIQIAEGWKGKVLLSFSNQDFDVGYFHFLLGFYRKEKGDELIRFSEFDGGFIAEHILEKDKMIFTWNKN